MKLTHYFKSFIKPPLKSVALVLSGGGARGAIHLGVLQALDVYKIKVEAISGCSMGAIIGSLYCAGIPPLEMKTLMKSKKFASIFHISWNKRGLLTMTRLKKTLNEFIPINDFESLKIPFYCCVSNLDTGKYEIMNTGDLKKSVAASATIPILFEPVEINGQHYIDGGLFNNLPVQPLLKRYKNIIGIHVNNYKHSKMHNIRAVAERVVTLASKRNLDERLEKCDYVINPYLDKTYRVLDFRHTNTLFDIGYQEGLKFIDKHCKSSLQTKP